jgi:hypothetical protein
MDEEEKKDYIELFDASDVDRVLKKIKDTEYELKNLRNVDSDTYQDYFNYMFSENKSMNRIFNIPLTLTTDGITGLTYGNMFTINYLMDIYEKQGIFPSYFITKVNHNISSSGWDTEITGNFLPIVK